METIVLSVSQLNRYIKGIVEQDRILSRVTIRGELSNFKAHYSGHFYFALKDETSVIKCVMFKAYASALRFMPESGMKVVVSGRVGVFERDGQYQIYVDSMQTSGVGDLHVAYEQLKAKLEEEGLFDASKKKPIPQYPKKIGVITSPTGAAIRDIINVLSRRYKCADIYIYPVLVQGDGAPSDIVKAINYFDRTGWADVLIVGRGGGSIEDLWAFNDEGVARAVYNCRIPVISAVGHETDFTIIDFVSDLRAPTPSAAAELAVPDSSELYEKFSGYGTRLFNAYRSFIDKKRSFIASVENRPVFKNPYEIIYRRRLVLDSVSQNMLKTESLNLARKSEKLSSLSAKLDALSPLKVIGRGYSMVESDGKPVTSVKNLSAGDEITLKMADGTAECEVKQITNGLTSDAVR